jgi:hypothetical protein
LVAFKAIKHALVKDGDDQNCIVDRCGYESRAQRGHDFSL